MSLGNDDVVRLAHLARLHLNRDEIDKTLAELNGIFSMIEQLQTVNTEGILPMAHPLDGTQRLRDDLVTDLPQREITMQNAPAQQDGLFLVPQVLE